MSDDLDSAQIPCATEGCRSLLLCGTRHADNMRASSWLCMECRDINPNNITTREN